MRSLQRVLNEAIDQREVVKAAEAWQALHRWPEVVGEGLAQRSWPDRFDHGTVYVAVSGSAWAQELRMLKPTILLRLGSLLGNRALVQDVRFGVRTLPPRPAKRKAAPEGQFDEQLSLHELTQRILSRANDEE